MAKVKLILDTRKTSKSYNSELFPIALRVYHIKPRMIRLPYHTSKIGWNKKGQSLKKSPAINKALDCDSINRVLYNKLHDARSLIHELGDGIQYKDVDVLVNEIKNKWQDKISPQLKSKIYNGLMLSDWGKVIIERKRKLNKPGSAEWYHYAIKDFIKFNPLYI